MSTFPATEIVHWPAGPVAACARHARQLVGLAAMLGSHVGVTVAPDGHECGNCRNEAAMDAPSPQPGTAEQQEQTK